MTIYRDDLKRVYKLIRSKKRWIQGHFSKTKTGKLCNPTSRYAACWCLDGAAMKSIRDYSYTDFENAINCSNPINYNDSHTHAEVIALLKNAIERAPVRP